MALLGPTAVAIHDDGYVPRQGSLGFGIKMWRLNAHLSERGSKENRLIASGADGSNGQLGAGQFGKGFEVGPGVRREVLPFADLVSRGFPAGEFGIDGMASRKDFHVARHMIVTLTAIAVSDADLDRFEGVQAIDVRNGQFVDTIDHGSVAGGHGVKPSATAWAASGRAELAAHGVKHVGNLGIFAWKRSLAYARGIGFHDADDAIHAMGRNAGAGAGAAGGGIGRGNERIGAVIDIEEGALRAFEQNILSALDGLMEEHNGVRHEGFQVIAGGSIIFVNLFEGKRAGAECFEDFVVFVDLGLELPGEAIRVDQVEHAQTSSRGFVAVGWADAAFGSADFIFAFENFALRIELAMIRKDQVGSFTEEQIAVGFDSEVAEAFDLFDQADG